MGRQRGGVGVAILSLIPMKRIWGTGMHGAI